MKGCVYTFEGKEYSEQEFKALIVSKMGGEPSIEKAISLFGASQANEFKEAANQSKGEKRTRGFAERAKAEGYGDVINEQYDSTDREKTEANAQRLFENAKSQFEAGDTGVFDRIQKMFTEMTFGELMDRPQLGALYATFFHKVAFYFNQKGDLEKAGQFINLQAEGGTAAGMFAAALSAESTPEAIANRIFKEDKERVKILQSTTKDGVSVKDVLKDLKNSGKLSKDEINEILSVLNTGKPRRAASTSAEKKENLRKKRREIMARINAKNALTVGGAFQSVPEILELAKTYIDQGVVSISDLKKKVWNDVKDVFKDGQKDVNKIIDDNANQFTDDIAKNSQKKAEDQLTKAFQGKALEGDKLRKKAITIISDMILRSDPEYASKKSSGQRLKAKERLIKILSNKDAISGMVTKAKQAAIAKVNSDSSLTAAEKQSMINAIEDIASGLIGMPVGMSNQRAAAQSLNDDEVKAAIDEIVRDHYENPTGEIKSLAQKLVEQLDIDPKYAENLQKQVEEKIQKKVNEKIDKKKAAIDKAIDSLGVKDKTSFKKAIVRAIASGKTNDKQFFGELLTAMGVKGFSAEDAQKMKDLVARMSVLDKNNEVYGELNKYLNDILVRYDEKTAAFIARWMQEQFFINALSDFLNTGVVNSGLGATLAFIGRSATNIIRNPRRFARAYKYNRTLRKNGFTAGIRSVGEKASNPMKNLGETTFVDKVTESAHGAVQRATEKSMRDLFNDFRNNKNNRRGYYLAQMVAKTFSHMMLSGKWPNSFKKIPFVKRGTELIPPPTMWSTAIMSVQDLFFGVVANNIETYIETERYLDAMNEARDKEGLKPLVKGSKEWNDALQELLPHSPEAIQAVREQVDKETADMINNGEQVTKGWAERRRRSLLRQKLPSEIVDAASHNAEKALTLNNPEGLGAYVVAIKNKYGQIKDTDGLLAFAKLFGNTALGFIRMTTVAAELSFRSIPVIGVSQTALVGKKARLNKGRVEWIEMSTEEKTMRYFENAMWSFVTFSLAMSLFDWEEEEEKDADGTPTGNKFMRFKLDPNSPIQFYGEPVSDKERNRMEGLGIKPNSVSVYGKNMELKFTGFQMAMIGKILGEISDNVRYEEPKTFIDKNGKKTRVNDNYWTPDMLMGLTTSQAFSADYSTPVKASKLFLHGQFMAGAEALMLDGVETSFSPSLYENIKTEIQALQGLQATAKDDITDRILGDIFWTDMLIDKNDRLLYDHFGQPIPITPKNYVVKALIGEQMYAEGADHVKNSKYYQLFNEDNKKLDPKDQWTPKNPYDPTEIFKSGYIPDEEFASEISVKVGQTYASYIDKYYEDLKEMPFNRRTKVLDKMWDSAIENIKNEVYDVDKKALPSKAGRILYGNYDLSQEQINEIRSLIGTR